MLIKVRFLVSSTFIILGLFVFFSKVSAQHSANPDFREVQPPTANNETIQITLHKAKLDNNGKTQYQESTGNKVVAGEALSANDIKSGFKSNEKVVIRVRSPYPYYIYIVNASDLDGIRLVQPFGDRAENRQFPSNDYDDFLFNFTKSNTTTSREEFLILISKTKIESPKLDEILKNKGRLILTPEKEEEGKKLLDSKLTAETTSSSTATPKTSKWIKVYSFGCNIAGIFLPFLNNICPKVTLGANPEFRDDQISVSPAQNKNQIAFAISFTVSQ
jgi:hypothetical protein